MAHRLKCLPLAAKRTFAFDTAATQLCKSAELPPTPCPLLPAPPTRAALLFNKRCHRHRHRKRLHRCRCRCRRRRNSLQLVYVRPLFLCPALPYACSRHRLCPSAPPSYSRFASCAPYLEFCLLLATYTSVP